MAVAVYVVASYTPIAFYIVAFKEKGLGVAYQGVAFYKFYKVAYYIALDTVAFYIVAARR